MLLVRINGQSRFELPYIFKEIIIKKGICRKYTLFPMQISFFITLIRKAAVVIVIVYYGG
jgi:hypothetical protein